MTKSARYDRTWDATGFGTMLRPSPVSDRWRGPGFAAERDVIGEMIQALKKRGIGFVLFSHALAQHTFTEEGQEQVGFNDPTDNYKKLNDFLNEIFAEMAERYGDEMMGIGFDSEFGLSGNELWDGKLDLPRLRETILSVAPHLQLYAVAGPNETCEFGHREVWRPSWLDPWESRAEDEFDLEDWPVYRRKLSAVLPAHWAPITAADEGLTHFDADAMYRYTVIQAAAATEGPGSAWLPVPMPTAPGKRASGRFWPVLPLT